jgi:geranylgeranyl diphosphate synthase type II
MGKPAGSDLKKRKSTYPSVYGMEKSREVMRELVDSAIISLKRFDRTADPLRRIAEYIIERKR